MVVFVACITSGLSTPAWAYPPDPDNAALIYYQAFLLCEPLETAEKDALSDFAHGEIELTEQIRRSVEGCRTGIDYAIAAAAMRQCNWGFRFSLGFNASMPHLAQLRFLARVIVADARVLAADGLWREAIERCLTVKRVAQHTGDDTLISMLVAGSVDRLANDCLRDLLGLMPADRKVLQWLKAELAVLSGKLPTAQRAMEHEREVAMETMRPENRHKFVAIFEGTDIQITPEQLAKMDEDFLAHNRKRYSEFVTSLETILGGASTYEQRYRKLAQLTDRMQTLAASDESAVLTAAFAPGFAGVYNRQVLVEAVANATQAAVDVYLARAEAGRLPTTLPAGLLKDPFSGEDFEYKRTDDGFLLRCRGKDMAKDEVHEYAFTAK